MIDEYMSGAIIPDDMPEDLLGNPDVQRLIDNAHSALSHFGGWIDPDSEVFEEHLDSAKLDGGHAVMERYQSMLADALHRQKMFGEVFDLDGFINLLSTIPIEEVLS